MSYSQTSNITTLSSTLTNTGTITLPTSSGTYSITTTGYGLTPNGTYSITAVGSGSGGYSSSGVGSNHAWASVSSKHSMSHHDVVIKRPNGKEIRVGELLESMMEIMMIIPNDPDLHGKNPALKDAYEHHQSLIREMMASDRLRESYESYNTLRKLVSQEDDD